MVDWTAVKTDATKKGSFYVYVYILFFIISLFKSYMS